MESFIYEKNFTFFCFYKIICDFLYSAVQLEYRYVHEREEQNCIWLSIEKGNDVTKNVKMLNPTAERSVS